MITFALNSQEEKIDISESIKGAVYYCLFCKEKMVAKKGNSLSHHFSHKENSCRQTENYLKATFLLYPYFSQSLTGARLAALKAIWNYHNEGFFVRRGQPGSASQILYQAGAGNLNATFDALVEEGFISDISEQTTQPLYAPSRHTQVKEAYTGEGEKVFLVTSLGQNLWFTADKFYKQVVIEKYQVSLKGKAVFCSLPLSQFCRWQFEQLSAHKVTDAQLLSQLIADVNGLNLYLLAFRFEGKSETIYKIGCSYRDPMLRIAEVLSEFKGYSQLQSHQVLFSLPGKGVIEFYFKKKYLPYRYTNPDFGIGSEKTEYFCFDALTENQVLLQLEEAARIQNPLPA